MLTLITILFALLWIGLSLAVGIVLAVLGIRAWQWGYSRLAVVQLIRVLILAVVIFLAARSAWQSSIIALLQAMGLGLIGTLFGSIAGGKVHA